MEMKLKSTTINIVKQKRFSNKKDVENNKTNSEEVTQINS